MRRGGAIPVALRTALASPGGTCYRHCDRPIRVRRLASRLSGDWLVQACPSGVVSVTTYSEWTRRDPTAAVRRQLLRWTVPASLVRTRDLRLATRHGPELGRAAERSLASIRPPRGVRTVYWRVYPFRARDGTERRLFACLRRTHSGPVFFVAPPTGDSASCPRCSAGRHSR